MIEDNKNGENEQIEKLINLMTETYYGRMKNLTVENVEEIYSNFVNLLQRDQKIITDGMKEKMIEVSKMYMDFIKNPEIFALLKSSSISKKELKERFIRGWLGLQERKYDMSDLYNKDLILKNDKLPNHKHVSIRTRQSAVKHCYLDEKGRRVVISDIGRLYYTEWNGSDNYLTLYKIEKENEAGQISEHMVISNIIISKMENIDYRDAVLNELLSEDNISKSMSAGYIGEIEPVDNESVEIAIGREKQNNQSYQYRINDKYKLHYEASAVSAAIDLLKQAKDINQRDVNDGKVGER